MFTPLTIPPTQRGPNDLFFIVSEQRILVKPDHEHYQIPNEQDCAFLGLDTKQTHFIGLWDEHRCYAMESSHDIDVPLHFEFLPFRDAFTHFSPPGIHAISLATQILTWDKNYRYCGKCGQPTKELEGERAKVCEVCKLTNYPRLSPSIIVSVVRDNSILLARSPRFPVGMYSVIAVFVEPGETLETCVKREIREEVGIEVDNIRYFGSQNWPFPHSLMIGFTAVYLSGEISIDNEEIVDARWFTREDLPKIPGRYSIARQLIDEFLK